MTIITINLGTAVQRSESAKAFSPGAKARAKGFKFAKVGGVTTLILPSVKRAAITSIKNQLKACQKACAAYVKNYVGYHQTTAKAKNAKTPQSKETLQLKAKKMKAAAAQAKKDARYANMTIRNLQKQHGLTGLIMPIVSSDLASPGTVVKADIKGFKRKGVTGLYAPKFTTQEKFDALDSASTKATKPATKATKPRTASKKPAGIAPFELLHGKSPAKTRTKTAIPKNPADAYKALPEEDKKSLKDVYKAINTATGKKLSHTQAESLMIDKGFDNSVSLRDKKSGKLIAKITPELAKSAGKTPAAVFKLFRSSGVHHRS